MSWTDHFNCSRRAAFIEGRHMAHDPENLRNLIGGEPPEIPEKRLAWAFLHRLFVDATHKTTQTSEHEQVQAIRWFYDRSEQPFGYCWTLSILEMPDEADRTMFQAVRAALQDLKQSQNRYTQGALHAYFSRRQP